MPRPCSVCRHKDQKEVEEALLIGEPYRAVARRFGLERSSLARHLERHVGPRIERAAHAKDQVGALDLWRRLSEIEVRARRIADAAEQAEDFRGAVSAIRELGRVVELVARLRGDFAPEAPGSVVNVVEVDEATCIRMAELFLLRRGRLPGTPPETAAIAHKRAEEPHDGEDSE